MIPEDIQGVHYRVYFGLQFLRWKNLYKSCWKIR